MRDCSRAYYCRHGLLFGEEMTALFQISHLLSTKDSAEVAHEKECCGCLPPEIGHRVGCCILVIDGYFAELLQGNAQLCHVILLQACFAGRKSKRAGAL